ncbi:hypothetical protein Tco_1580696, partial [Tanacetum coccineum]
MASLPPREQRYPFRRYQSLEYTDTNIADFEESLGPERQPDAAAGAPEAAEDAPADDEGSQADPKPVQAHQKPP